MKRSKSNKKTILGSLITLIALVMGIYFFLQLRPTPISINEIAPTGVVALSLNPATISLTAGTQSTISLIVNSGSNKVTIVKFEITFDPSKLTVTNLTTGTWLTAILATPSITSGKISGMLAAKPNSDAGGGPELNRTGSGTLLTFKVKGTTPGSYPLTFNNAKTSALIASSNSEMLKSTAGTIITITTPNVAPTISTHPVTQTIVKGENATFSVVATGNPTPTYQWTKNGVNISGATGSSLTLTNVQATINNGIYKVIVTNTVGSITSNGATLTVKLATDLVGTNRIVDIFDYNAFITQYGGSGTADFNHSNVVDLLDYAYFLADYGKTW